MRGRSVTLAMTPPLFFLTPEGTRAELGLNILIWTVEIYSAFFFFFNFYFFAHFEMHKFTI